MTLRQLEYFLAVVDEGSMARAALRMHVAQPSLSQQIRSLEAEFGADLFERLPRSTRLTAFGQEFVPQAREVVLAARRAARTAAQIRSGDAGYLEIATVRSIAVGLLPPTLQRWHESHPGTGVRMHEFGHRAELEDNMAIGIADVAVGPQPAHWEGEIDPLGYEEFVVVLAPANPLLASTGPVALKALANCEFVLFDGSHGLSELIGFACAQAGFVPRSAIRTSQVEAAARLAAAGMGPAIIPSNAVPGDLSSLARRLTPSVGRRLVCYARGRFSPAVRTYVEVIHEEVTWPTEVPEITVP